MTFGLSALVGAITTVVVEPGETWLGYLAAIGITWLGSMRGYFAGIANGVQARTGGTGIGRSGAHEAS